MRAKVRIVLFCIPFLAVSLCLTVNPAFSENAGTFVFPLMAPRLTSRFGVRNHPIRKVRRHHTGIDLAAPIGSHIRVVAAGRVVFADTYAGYGKLITVFHENGRASLYGHLDEIVVEPNEFVTAGQVIGRLGNSGESTGPHLHFEWRRDGNILNPLEIFPDLVAEPQG